MGFIMSNEYQRFLATKMHTLGDHGFFANWVPECAFDFQRSIITKAVQKGRIGVFADTGLGKTLMQLSFAYNVVLHTNKPVLILTPLAVAFQFLAEAEKIGIDDIEHTKDGMFKKKIVVCNYERLHHLNADDFAAARFDEDDQSKQSYIFGAAP